MCDDHIRLEIMQLGGTHLATVPADLGRVVRLRARGDRLLAYTDSGAVMIVYAPTGEEDQ
jgi:hypothetical protein